MLKIPLVKGVSALVDDRDIRFVNNFKWNTGSRGYVTSCINGKVVLLHRFIMNAPKGMEVDHINGNPLDNRRINLRLCNSNQNKWNRTKSINKSSKFKGVYWDVRTRKWIVGIRKNYKHSYLGSFSLEQDAAKAYNNAAIKYFGEFAKLNKV